MDELLEEISVQKKNISDTLFELGKILSVERKTNTEYAALAVYLHNIYNGIENILKRILTFQKIPIPKSEFSHKELLNISVENNIISSKLCATLNKYREFRHFFVHAYVLMLDEKKLKPLIDTIFDVYGQFEKEINAFLEKPVN